MGYESWRSHASVPITILRRAPVPRARRPLSRGPKAPIHRRRRHPLKTRRSRSRRKERIPRRAHRPHLRDMTRTTAGSVSNSGRTSCTYRAAERTGPTGRTGWPLSGNSSPIDRTKSRRSGNEFAGGTTHQKSRPPTGTSVSGVMRTTAPAASGTPRVKTSDMNGPICRGAKLTTASTSRPTSASAV